MSERVEIGGRRARYRGTPLGPMTDEAHAHAPALAAALAEMEALGLAPVLEDGAVAGNGASRLPSGAWLLSASARRAGEPAVVEVVRFDPDAFAVEYRGEAGREPTSDVALHLAVLTSGAGATLHGHALASASDAVRLGIAISEHDTPFGTPEDLAEMQTLLARAPYPAHRAWIRRGHGFLVAGATIEAARTEMRRLAAAR